MQFWTWNFQTKKKSLWKKKSTFCSKKIYVEQIYACISWLKDVLISCRFSMFRKLRQKKNWKKNDSYFGDGNWFNLQLKCENKRIRGFFTFETYNFEIVHFVTPDQRCPGDYFLTLIFFNTNIFNTNFLTLNFRTLIFFTQIFWIWPFWKCDFFGIFLFRVKNFRVKKY